jgi:hypothetical protein
MSFGKHIIFPRCLDNIGAIFMPFLEGMFCTCSLVVPSRDSSHILVWSMQTIYQMCIFLLCLDSLDINVHGASWYISILFVTINLRFIIYWPVRRGVWALGKLALATALFPTNTHPHTYSLRLFSEIVRPHVG